MALTLGALYDALRSAGVDEDKARRVAEEVIGFRRQIGRLKSDLIVLKWRTGCALAINAVIPLRVFA